MPITWRARRQLRARWGRARDRSRPLALVAEHHRLRAGSGEARGTLDDRTWADLHLDDVFTRLDHTDSTVGQQVLYHRLRSGQRQDLDAFEAIATRAADDPAARERLQLALTRLRAPAGYHLCALGVDPLPSPRWHVAFPLLTALMVAAIGLAAFFPVALFAALNLAVVNVFVRLLLAGPMGEPLAAFRQIAPLMAAAEAVARLDCPAGDAILRPVRDAIPRLRTLRFWTGWSGRQGLDELTGAVLEYVNLLLLLDANALYFGARAVNRHAADLAAVVDGVGHIDAAIAIASFRAGTAGWTRPTFRPRGEPLGIVDARHPLVPNAVPNTIALGPAAGILLTGANMSGKSTLLRTLGVNVVLAQTVHTCFATAYRGPALDVRTLMGRSDDLVAGQSYYSQDVARVVELMDRRGGAVDRLLIFDELFRGTNAIERVAAAAAVLEHLARSGPSGARDLVVAATHDAELVPLLAGVFAPFHLADGIGPDGPVFHYTLAPGPATTRTAIALLELFGAPDDVVRRSRAIGDRIDAAARARA
jgi:hypothetical protein